MAGPASHLDTLRCHAGPGRARPARPGPRSSRPSSGSGTRRRRASRSTPACRRRPAGRCSRRWPRPRSSTSTASSPLDGGRAVEAGDALVVATSGTTGDPKGVVLTHDAVVASADGHQHPARRRHAATAGWPACRWPTSAASRSSPGPWSRARRSPCCPASTRTRSRPLPRPAPTSSPLVPTALRPHRPARFRVIVLGGARPPAELAGQRRHDLRHDRDRQRRRLRRPAPRRRRGSPGRRRRDPPAGADAAAGLPRRHATPRTPTAGSPPATSVRWMATAAWWSTAGAAT